MPLLPESEAFLLVRTHFGDDKAWTALRAIVDNETEEGFVPTVEYVDDPRFAGFSVEDLTAVHPHRADDWDVMYVAERCRWRSLWCCGV